MQKTEPCDVGRDSSEQSEGRRLLYEASSHFVSRVRPSPLRSHHNTRKNGISESMKNRGPPRRWIRLLIICGPELTQRSPITRIRNAFRTIASGITKAISAKRRHGVFKNILAA